MNYFSSVIIVSNSRSVDDEWKGLTNALAGLFCASLNFVNPSNSMSPEFTFRPMGVVEHSVNSSHLRYSSLPREIVCTENLTPFKKLLPCNSKVRIEDAVLGLLSTQNVIFQCF